MYHKSKKHYFHHTSRRYEDSKLRERFALIGLAGGVALGALAGGFLGAIIGGFIGACAGTFVGHIVVTFR